MALKRGLCRKVSAHVVLLILSLPHFHESDFLFALYGRQRMNKSRNAPVTRAESGNSLQGWEVDEAIEERSGQVNFGCFYNAKGVSPWGAECSSPL